MPGGYLTISDAAKHLGVSAGTLRNWEKIGKIKAIRFDGKNRHFAIEDLDKIKNSDHINIKEASKLLGVSTSTLRRLSGDNQIPSIREENGYRAYKYSDIKKYLETKDKKEIPSSKKGKELDQQSSAVIASNRLDDSKAQKSDLDTKFEAGEGGQVVSKNSYQDVSGINDIVNHSQNISSVYQTNTQNNDSFPSNPIPNKPQESEADTITPSPPIPPPPTETVPPPPPDLVPPAPPGGTPSSTSTPEPTTYQVSPD
ncbi:helix-turn-helix domain-containing protein, partial [Patescibacteria group bacterium]